MAYSAGCKLASKSCGQLMGTIFETKKEMRVWHSVWAKQGLSATLHIFIKKKAAGPLAKFIIARTAGFTAWVSRYKKNIAAGKGYIPFPHCLYWSG